MQVRRSLSLVLLMALGLASVAHAEVQNFTVIANGEKVGHLDADVQPARVSIDYAVVNNGRGPKTHEVIELGAGGAPTRWTVDGESLFGNAVHESFALDGHSAQWTSQPDSGKVEVAAPRFYVAADASPWMLGQYARALLKAPDNTLPVLPSGAMHLDLVKALTVGTGPGATHVTLYEIGGLDLTPAMVALDDSGALFALPGSGLIRAGHEADLKALGAAVRDLALSRAEAAQTKLAHRFTTPVLIRNVHVFDPASLSVGGLSQVEVYDDKIVTVTPEQPGAPNPKGATVIDGQGGTLVPGLHDMHHHMTLSSALYNLAAGVTGVRDMGNDNNALIAWSRLIDEGKLAGPRIVRNGLLEGRSPYSVRTGMIADTLDQAITDVHWYADHGYWQIKLYNSFNPDWVAPVAAEAHRLGMGVTGHVPAFSSPDRVLREGYNDIAHINQLMLGWILDPTEDTRTPLRLTGMARGANLDLTSPRVQATVALMKEKGAKLDTTSVILERLMLSRAGEIQTGDKPYLSHMPIGYQRYRKRAFVTLDQPGADAAYQGGFKKVLQVMKMLDDNGIEMMPGTDDTTGFTLLRELELYVQAGISPAKTLRLATLDDEHYFKHDQMLGSIERGKLADFVLVDGDPTKDISVMRKNRMTVKGGVIYFPAEIYRHLNVEPFAPPPPLMPAN